MKTLLVHYISRIHLLQVITFICKFCYFQSEVHGLSDLKLDELIFKNDHLQKENMDLIHQLHDKSHHCDELTGFMEALGSERELLSKERDQIMERLLRRDEEVKQLLSQTDELQQEKDLMMEQLLTLEDLQRENHKLKVKVAELESEKKELLSEDEQLKEKLLVIGGEKEAVMSRVTYLEQLEKEKEELIGQLVEKDAIYKEVCCLLEELTAERNGLQKDKKSLQTKVRFCTVMIPK